jgi:ABC-type transport system substrate-binding protein
VWGGAYFNYSVPPFDKKEVRQAFSKAIDRQGILSALDEPGAVGGGAGLTHISQFARFYMDPINDSSPSDRTLSITVRPPGGGQLLKRRATDGIELTRTREHLWASAP